ncbi:hypothetical protein HKCCE2091_17340 [Rhodobacterales bacterium HKCCE2091]|nr:hypothetical protein [Rhodobacterales bacterium HKCCE2091]
MKLIPLAALAVVAAAGAASACPNPGAAGLGRFSANEQDLIRGLRFAVNAGGTSALAGCGQIQAEGGPTSGFFLTAPHITLSLSGTSGQEIFVGTITEGSCDPDILVLGTDRRWHFDDDARNPDAQLVIRDTGQGPISIWVGTDNGGPCATQVFVRIRRSDNPNNAPGGGSVSPSPGGGGGGGGGGGFT